jgi:hypothetical protein
LKFLQNNRFLTHPNSLSHLSSFRPAFIKSATQQGFGTQEKIDLTTIAGQNVQLDFNLAPAGVSAEQIVTLEGDDAPVVDTTRTVVGGTVTQREIEELPNISRNRSIWFSRSAA